MKKEKMSSIKLLPIIWVVVLISIDQGIKLFIAHSMMETQFTIIPHIFNFQTYHNVNLGWIPNMLDFMMPLYMAVAISVIVMLLMVVYYRHLKFLTNSWEKYSKLPEIFLIFVLGGGFCKLIDDIFWGGSLDYIQLFDWFIFDLKDVYLTTIALPIAIFIIITLEVRLQQLPKEKRKEEKRKQSFWYWVKLGFPMKP